MKKHRRKTYRLAIPAGEQQPSRKAPSPARIESQRQPNRQQETPNRLLRLLSGLMIVGLVVVGGWIAFQLATSIFLNGKGRSEAEAVARVVGFTEEQTWLLKLFGGILVVEAAGTALVAIGFAMTIGRRIRWRPLLLRLGVLAAFFSIKPTIAALLQRDQRDGGPAIVEEVDPFSVEAFDSRTRQPLIGVSEGPDGKLRAHNLTRGFEPKTGVQIREITTTDMARFRVERERHRSADQ